MKVLDTVAVRHDLKEPDLPAGLVGTIVEEWQPGVFEVEFADLDGRTYAFAAIATENLLLLHHSLERAA